MKREAAVRRAAARAGEAAVPHLETAGRPDPGAKAASVRSGVPPTMLACAACIPTPLTLSDADPPDYPLSAIPTVAAGLASTTSPR